MKPDKTRRDFIRGGTLATAGLLAAGASSESRGEQPADQPRQDPKHQHGEYPRDHAGPGGPVGSPTDRGKLVRGRTPSRHERRWFGGKP